MIRKGFTLIELLVVIAIIGLLATISIVALSNSRARARDALRLSDIKQIQTALNMYWERSGIYPPTAMVVPGGAISYFDGLSTTTLMAVIPTPPTPTNDGNCPTLIGVDNKYNYLQIDNGLSYELSYCLGFATSDLSAGPASATPISMK